MTHIPAEDAATGPAPESRHPAPGHPDRPQLVPRYRGQGYDDASQARRRAWLEEKTGASLDLVGRTAIPGESMRGNVENPVGAAQMPLGVAGPLRVVGDHADGLYYVPMATTEGALVRSYERGMVALTRSGGARVRVWTDENRVAPLFRFPDAAAAIEFIDALPELTEGVRAAAEATTRHGRLLRLIPHPLGREVIVDFAWFTGDAQGMNMIVRGTEAGARWLVERTAAESFLTFSGMSSEKRIAGNLLAGGKGKRVTASAHLPASVLKTVLGTDSRAMQALWRGTVLGHLQAGSVGFNAHYANGLTALFIATGQDVANVANAAVGLSVLEATPEGDLHASVHLPSLTVATVGGGTGLGTSRECLEMLGCLGSGRAAKLAEITAAAVLAGELSMSAAIAGGDFAAGHERYGRNRPGEDTPARAQDVADSGRGVA